jgi:hypothetical protein
MTPYVKILLHIAQRTHPGGLYATLILMTGTNHMLTGTAIALAVKQPLLAAPLAFVSHFVLDAIPHAPPYNFEYGNTRFSKAMVADATAGIALTIAVMIMVPHLAPVVAVGAFFAILPDLTWAYFYGLNRRNSWFYKLHTVIQWFERPPGIIVEACYFVLITLVIAVLILKEYHGH